MSRNLAISARALSWVLLLSSPVLAAGVSEEVVSFTTQDDLPIECILSYPSEATGPFPGMLLIPGSGLHDADVSLDVPTLEITQGPQFLFRSLARYFSRRGWAVQRCNKRGASFDHAEDRPAILENATLEELTEDARLALAALHGHPRVVASPLVVLGHSEGSLVATRLAQTNPGIDLLVLMGSVARRMDALIEYQLVERNLSFLRQAADANGDGNLTLVELNLLDGNFGLGSVYIFNCAEILFRFKQSKGGKTVIEGFNTQTDANGNGRLHIAREIEPALRREASRFLEMAADGDLGRYWQSLVVTEALASQIHRVDTRILFVHGALDVQTPVDEPLTMMARLESKGLTNYDVLIFPTLGHSLSPPNDFYRRDGGLTSLDNLTLNAPRAKTRRLLLAQIEANLPR